jgi:hypothetical protein
MFVLPTQQALVGMAGKAEIVQGCAGLWGKAQWNGTHAGLCRPGGHSLVEMVNVCGHLALRAHPMEIMVLRGGSLG